MSGERFAALHQGDSVLVCPHSQVDAEELNKIKSLIQETIGSSGSLVIDKEPESARSYQYIISNVVPVPVASHSQAAISSYLSGLDMGGTLELEELVLLSELSNTVCPVSRKEEDLVSLLKLAGFVDVVVHSTTPLSDEELAQVFKVWGASRIDQGITRLSGKFGRTHITGKRPSYEIGQKISLRRNKPAQTVPDSGAKAVWTVSGSDEELEDEDDLLDEEDKIKPSKESLTRPDDCELTNGRRKACKNCTCGRAEADMAGNVVALDLADDFADEIIEVDPTPKKTGCGNCPLGDAFRCATCPYLGMPAFSEGEKITLGGAFGSDDLDL